LTYLFQNFCLMNSTFFRDQNWKPTDTLTRHSTILKLLLGVLCLITCSMGQENKKAGSDVGAALDSIFDVRRAPKAKSMGLLRGSFLDALSPKQKLQVAFVIDTTESMESQVVSIRTRLPNMVADLERLADGNVESTAVTISDVGNTGTPSQILSPTFLSPKLFADSISQLKVADGRPYFLEPVDLGIYTALQQLPWSNEDNVQKWIIFLGDAPPYEPAFVDAKTSAKRWYETDVLIDLANQKNIKIHCLLCKSREKEREAFEKTLDRTRQFMGKLSSETGGLMLDTSYSQVQKELAVTARRNRAQYSRVGLIGEAEIKAIRDALAAAGADSGIQRVAVLPLMRFDQLKFDYGSVEVQLSTELRKHLKQSPNLRVTKPRELEKEIDRMRFEGIPTSEWRQALCLRLRIDFIISGTIQSQQNARTANVFVHGHNSKDHAAQITATSKQGDLGKTIVRQLASAVNTTTAYIPLKAHLSKLTADQNFKVDGDGILDLSDMNRSQLFAAIEAIEQAIDYSSGNPEGTRILKDAEKKLSTILQNKPRQPLV